jgi:hypothetical protein
MLNDSGVKKKPITTHNLQANAIVDMSSPNHCGDIIQRFELHDNYLDEDDAASVFAIRATYHSALQMSPGHLVFG